MATDPTVTLERLYEQVYFLEELRRREEAENRPVLARYTARRLAATRAAITRTANRLAAM